MKKDKLFLKIIMYLSIIGFLTSVYLVQNHLSPPTSGSACDISETISCSLVNSSVFSELFNVPVAVFGALWFVILFFLSLKAEKKTPLFSGMLLWSIAGVLFVIYMIIAEIILQAICPYCTVVHVITLIVFVLSIFLYQNNKKPKKKELIKVLKPWIILVVILNLLPILFFNIFSENQKDHTELAKCINEKGVNMYGSFRCSFCAKTRSMFGTAFQYINEIECHPQGENPQTELCLEKGVQETPLWVLEPEGNEIKRHSGFLSIDELKEFSGCE
jgi:uncharacterized membrane protein